MYLGTIFSAKKLLVTSIRSLAISIPRCEIEVEFWLSRHCAKTPGSL
jgi:hypothetical protein